MEIPKAYEAKNYEDNIYSREQSSGFFSPDVPPPWVKELSDTERQVFSMVLPPPNVTGVLHMGHAAMLAIEDLITRYHRMKGDYTLWLPGTDHAAIATQTKVEKLLMGKGIQDPKKELGRERFLSEVDKFAQESHDTIVNQCKKMGSSLDWEREAFTLDQSRTLAVRTVFKKMYDDGLIERGYRIVNWCPRCHSTLADDEVEYREQSAKIYTFKYSSDFPFAIATTRPETKLGDTAVAVNPEDKRYKKFIGKVFEVKSFANGADLQIKIIAEGTVDKNFGTGAVGVTPAHSHVDYEMAEKNNLPVIKIIDEDGKMTLEAGKTYQGLSVKEARKKVVEYLREHDLLEKEEDAPNNLSVCYRCDASIEPLPSRQWFIKVNKKFKLGQSKIQGIKTGKETTLKELMQAVVRKGQVKIIPDRFEKIYFNWVDNLRDWCISRQIWYGHQIPVWYRKDPQSLDKNYETDKREVHVGVEPPVDSENWEQDPDTLDTWFSSGLWTFSTLGWPKETDDLKKYHPTSVLETGYDILFFWIARMILMTTYTLGDVPFETIYLHGLVRDDKGRKMSKSLNNVINPLDMIDKFGADATRLSLLIGSTPGNDLKLSEDKIAAFRNFTNKLWNISRFILTNVKTTSENKPEAKTAADQWILSRLNEIVEMTTRNIEQYHFSIAGEKLRDFTWGELADWYLEIAKIEEDKSEILSYILNTILKLWHPFMPFVTEAIWQEMKKDNLLLVEKWPEQLPIEATNSVSDFEVIKNIITGIRSIRADYKIEPAKKLNVSISAGKLFLLLSDSSAIIKGLSRLEDLIIDEKVEKPEGCAGFVESGSEVYINLSGIIDFKKEKDRISKEIASVNPYILSLEKKLSNNEFVNNAPKEVVEIERQKLKDAEEKISKLNIQLQNLS